MVQGPSSANGSTSARQEISTHLWKAKIYYRVHKSRREVSLLTHPEFIQHSTSLLRLRPVPHFPRPCALAKTLFDLIRTNDHQVMSFLEDSGINFLTHFVTLPCVLQILPIAYFLISALY